MTCKHFFKAVALALSLAVGAAPALAKNFTELKAAASPAGGAWYVGMGAMGKAISTMYPELDVSLFPGGGLANVMHVEKGASASPRTASSSRRPRASIPTRSPLKTSWAFSTCTTQPGCTSS